MEWYTAHTAFVNNNHETQQVSQKTTGKLLDILLWNVEGIKSIISSAPEDIWRNQDVIIATETFLTEPFSIADYYTAHSYAKPKAVGRPEGGVSLIFKPTIGQLKEIVKEENLVIVKTTDLTIVGMYITYSTSIEDTTE